jgi:hypothetical protein
MNSPTTSPNATPTTDNRYAGFVTDDEEYIVYDRDRPEAWVQSDLLVALEP